MKDLCERLGSKVYPDNGIIGFVIEIAYSIALILITIFLPEILSMGDPVLRSQMIGVGGFQMMFLVIGIILPIHFLRGEGISFSGAGFGSGARGKYGDQGSAKKGTSASLKGLTGNDGIVLSLRNRLSAEKSCEHIAIIGPTGSGKSSCFYIPNLLEFKSNKEQNEKEAKWSAVVTDPKGEMYDLCGPYLRSKGYRTIKLAPLESDSEFYYNPILIAKDPDELDALAQLILTNGGKSVEQATGSSSGGAEWIGMSTPLFAAALIWARYCGKEKTVYEAVKFILDSDLKTMEGEFKKNQAAYDKFLLFKTSGGSERTMSSIKTTLSSNVQLFTRESTKRFTSTPSKRNAEGKRVLDKNRLFNPKILREEPIVVFICCPETQSIAQMPLMSVLYSQILEKCMEYKGERKIMFLLDEFANIGIIPTIASIAATARSRGICLALGLQGMEQLEENYGQEKAANLLNNLKTKIIFAGLTGQSAEYASELAGVTTVETKSFSRNSGQGFDLLGTTSSSKNAIQRQLYTPDEIRRLPEDTVLIIAHNRDTVEDKKNSWFKQKKYKNRVQEGKESEDPYGENE